MELPIRVMIVLFVAVVVAGLVIVFSQQLLNDARTNIDDFTQQDVKEGHIIELSAMTQDDVLRLARQCVQDYYTTFDEIDCFAVFLDTPVTMPDDQLLVLGHSFNTTLTQSTAFRLTFQPTQSRVVAR